MQRSKLHVSIRNPQSRYSDEKGDETKTLLEAVNKALGELAEDGTLTELENILERISPKKQQNKIQNKEGYRS